MSCCIACDLTVFSPAQRAAHEADTAALLALAATVVRTDAGYRLDFAETPGALLGRWALDERRCCPFFEIHIAPRVLEISGPADALPILEALFAAR